MKYISILRGINVSGKRMIKMAELKNLYEALGLINVITYIQSGNVVFETYQTEEAEIAKKIELSITKSYGFDVPVLVKTVACWEKVINSNPYINDCNKEISRFHVTFLSGNVAPELAEMIRDIKSGNDAYLIVEKAVYLYCPDGYGRTKFTNTFFEKKLKTKATTRNWETVKKLLEIAKQG